MRDITLEDTIYIRFPTRSFSTGAPTTLAGSPVLSIYEENNLTPITSGVSVSVDYDGIAGLNQATVVATSANGYESGKSYDLIITTGTVGGVPVVGEVVGSFTIQSSAAAVDLANATDGLGALKTLIDTVDTVVDGIQTDLSNGTDGLGALKTLIDTVDTVVDAVKVVTDKFVFTVANQVDANTLSVSGTAQTANDIGQDVNDILVDTAEIGAAGAGLTAINLPDQTMNITGNLSGSVGSVTGAVGSVTGSVGSVTGHTNQTGDTYALANGATGFAAIDTVVDAIKVVTDRQEELMVAGTASGTPTKTTMVSDISITADDQFNGRIITFRKDTTTTALQGQQTDITDSTAATNTLTFTALTTAPASGDTFEVT